MEQGRSLEILRALYDHNGTRLSVLWLLFNGAKTVSELASITGVEQSAMSHHLQVLRRAGLVKTKRVHKQIYYRLTSGTGFATLIEALQLLNKK